MSQLMLVHLAGPSIEPLANWARGLIGTVFLVAIGAIALMHILRGQIGRFAVFGVVALAGAMFIYVPDMLPAVARGIAALVKAGAGG